MTKEICKKCGKTVIVWGDLADQLCITCDESRRKNESKTTVTKEC